MWLIIVAVVVPVLAFIVWRLSVVLRGRKPTRSIDSGHPHLSDVDPHVGARET